MSRRLEVRANLNFGSFRQGRVYEISIDDDRMMSLLGVGYLEPTSDLEEDYAELGRPAELGVGTDSIRASRPGDGDPESVPPPAVGEADDVADRPEPSGSAALGASTRPGSRTGIVDASPRRRKDSRKAGDA